MSNPAPSPATSSTRAILRKLLRIVFVGTTLLLVLALGLAVGGWRKSRTPLEALPAGSPAAVDVAAYQAGEIQFPESEWVVADPARLGWSTEKLAAAHEFARDLDSSSVMVIHRGVLVAAWGDVAVRENSQSIRKSLLSSLFGFLVADSRLDLDANLMELGIDDNPPLTDAERRATVRQLLGTRSGIYHSALYEAGSWKRNKPERGSHAPGEHWYYNNWDFNALATIYQQAAGKSLDQAFAESVATPIEMEDYRPRDVVYLTREHASERLMGNVSDHHAYVFMISARDLARYGLLYLTDGRWRAVQVLPAGWVEQSTLDAALPSGQGDLAFGYMWWIYPASKLIDGPQLVARGGRGHRMIVIPSLDLIIVHRIPDGGAGVASQLFRRFVWHAEVSEQDLDELVAKILSAMPQPAAVAPGDETPPE